MLDLNNLDLDEIAQALQDQTDYERFHLIDSRTGEMLYWTRELGIDGQNPVDLDELDDENIVINPLPSYVWYQDMVEFAEGISDERAGRQLARAIDGRGAFRRFKNELYEEYPDLVDAWHSFRDTRARRRAVEWLRDKDLIDTGAADRHLAEHSDPKLP